jgi:hypothetical protein
MATSADELIVGAIDLHCHHGPDPHRERSVDAAEAVQEAADIGMAAVVLKSHAYPTGPIAVLLQDEMLRCGVPASAVDAMARTNPARLLGLA